MSVCCGGRVLGPGDLVTRRWAHDADLAQEGRGTAGGSRTAPVRGRGGRAPEIIARLCGAREYLAAHCHERLTLAHGAGAARLSLFYFHRAFTRLFNETPHAYVTRVRIERAKWLLLAGRASITEICFDVGYESLGSFSTRFRTLVGAPIYLTQWPQV